MVTEASATAVVIAAATTMVVAAEVAAASSSIPLQMYYQCSADKLHLNKYQIILFTSAVMSVLIQNA